MHAKNFKRNKNTRAIELGNLHRKTRGGVAVLQDPIVVVKNKRDVIIKEDENDYVSGGGTIWRDVVSNLCIDIEW